MPVQTIASNESQSAKMSKAVGQDAESSSAINPADMGGQKSVLLFFSNSKSSKNEVLI